MCEEALLTEKAKSDFLGISLARREKYPIRLLLLGATPHGVSEETGVPVIAFTSPSYGLSVVLIGAYTIWFKPMRPDELAKYGCTEETGLGTLSRTMVQRIVRLGPYWAESYGPTLDEGDGLDDEP